MSAQINQHRERRGLRRYLWAGVGGLIVVAATGCTQLTKGPRPGPVIGARPAAETRKAWPFAAARKTDQATAPRRWATAIPQQGTRAELIAAKVPGEVLAGFLPQQTAVRLVSATQASSPLVQIEEINGRSIRNLQDIMADDDARPGGQVSLRLAGSSGAAMRLPATPELLAVIHQFAAPQQWLIRGAEEGQPCLLVRQPGVRCKLTARIERRSGLLQLIVSLQSTAGQDRVLPREIQVRAGDNLLRCLTASEVLERLYGTGELSAPAANAASFAAVSERVDYAIPTNYERLREAAAKAPQQDLASGPALFEVPGTAYPGPAMLGDARALSGLLLQQQIYRTGGAGHNGWILFDGAALRDGGPVDIELDLGNGPVRLRFVLPAV